MCRILILADINPMGIGFHAVVVFGLGKDYLFKSMLGRCGRVARFNDQQKYTGFQPDPRPADPALSKARDIYAKGPMPNQTNLCPMLCLFFSNAFSPSCFDENCT